MQASWGSMCRQEAIVSSLMMTVRLYARGLQQKAGKAVVTTRMSSASAAIQRSDLQADLHYAP